MEPVENHPPHTKLMLLILTLVLLGASVGGYIISQNLKNKSSAGFSQTPLTPTVVPTLIPYPTNGTFALKTTTSRSSVGDIISVDLIAHSGKSSVAGFDVVLSYDKSALERQSVQNMVDSFRIYTYDRTTDRTSISGTKNISVTTPVLFANTPLLRFTFLAKKSGTYTMSLEPVGPESSKMVSESAEVTYPKTSDIRLEIR